jgi:hypothetical protein
MARVLYPRSVAELRAVLEERGVGVPLTLRGTGNSYGDASTGSRGVLDCCFARIPCSIRDGIAEVEPGVTCATSGSHAAARLVAARGLGHDFGRSAASPPPSTARTTRRRHGGDAILEFDLLDARGLHTLQRERESDLFHAAIGAFGLLGAFTRIRLQTKHVESGELEVTTFAGKNLRELMDFVLAHVGDADYLVGWIDCFARGDALGRGQIHHGRHLHGDEDPHPERTLALAHQELSPMVFGLFPKSELWRVTRFLNNTRGMRFLNAVRYWQGRLEGALPPRR